MDMLFLDTSIWEANNFLESNRIKQLLKLSESEYIKLVLPKLTYDNDSKLFKKMNSEIWEFRSKYLGKQNRLLAFWDKTDGKETLVIATHGFVKKSKKTPSKEIDKAKALRQSYFSNNQINNHGL